MAIKNHRDRFWYPFNVGSLKIIGTGSSVRKGEPMCLSLWISMNLVPMNLVSSRQLFYRLTYYFLNNSNALSSSSITRWYSLDSSSSHTHSLLLINLLFPFFPRSYKINATKRIYGRKEDSGQGWRWQGYTENMAAPRVCGVWRYCKEIHQEARVSVSAFQCFSAAGHSQGIHLTP